MMQQFYLFRGLIVLLFLFGCAEKRNPTDEVTEHNLNNAKELFKAFNQHNWQKMANFYAKDAIFLDPAYGTTWVKRNRAALVANYEAMEKSSPDIKDEITAIFAADEKVSIQFRSSGTTEGHQWSVPISTVLTFKDGKIISDATYYDK